MAQDFLSTYKYGWKTSYYQNTYDVKKDADENDDKLKALIADIESSAEDDCDSCKV
jgi:ribonucleoside-diphosphate reductase alpha chain